MKKHLTGFVALLLGFFVFAVPAFGEILFDSGPYVRTTKAPNIYNGSFLAEAGDARLVIFNGTEDGKHRVTSAEIIIKGQKVFGPKDFKQKQYYLETSVSLSSENSVFVELRSKPNTFLSIQITRPSVAISANPEKVLLGTSSTLEWLAEDAAVAVIDSGIGSVALQGSQDVFPAETTTYTITVTDSIGQTASATTEVWVNHRPVANFQSVTTDEDIPTNITLSGSDVDGDPLSYRVVTEPLHGKLSGLSPNLIYTPELNYNGNDLFSFTVNDGMVDAEPVNVEITLNPVNDVPVAADDAAVTDEDTVLITDNVLVNDHDVDGDTLEVASVTQPTNGSVVDNGDGTFTYTPTANYNGSDSFSYTVNDGNGGIATATVSVTIAPVNDAPVADPQAVTTDEDTEIAITISGSDVDGDTLSYQVVASPTHGVLNGTVPNLTYTSNQDYNGADSFSFITNDGELDSETADLTITINPVNDAPIADAGPDQEAYKGDTVVLNGSDSSDVDGDALSYNWTIASAPTGSTATLSDYSSVSPTLIPDAAGSYEFQLVANDGTVGSVADQVVIIANPRMAAVPSVVGLTQADAESAITSSNLTVGEVTTQHDDRIPTGQVISQDPAARISLEEGSPVDLVVSLGPVLLPTITLSVTPDTIEAGGSTTLTWSTANADSVSIDLYGRPTPVALSGSMNFGRITSTITYTLTATGPGGSTTESVTVTVQTQSQLPTISFSANPDTVFSSWGETTLTWSTTNAETVTLEFYFWGWKYSYRVPLNYSMRTWVNSTTTYTLIATGSGGTTTESVTVTRAVYRPPPTVDITATPEVIVPGESARISWGSTNASSITISNGIGIVGGSGTLYVSPSETTTYAITATGHDGTIVTDSVTVTVTSVPPTAEINATSSSILKGDASLIYWATTHAKLITIEPNIGAVASSGSVSVVPVETTTYTITATGHDGTIVKNSVTVTVSLPPPTASISINPVEILEGHTTTLTWSSTEADSVVIEPGFGEAELSGSLQISPSETTTYTITATGPGGIATSTSTITVTHLPPTVSINSSEWIIEQGDFTTLTWSSTKAESIVIEPDIGEVGLNGSLQVFPSETTTYVITATGKGGTAVDSIKAGVFSPHAPISVDINASSEVIELGDSITLSWSSNNAVSVSIDNGIGPVSNQGSMFVTPLYTTTYAITAAGGTGIESSRVVVTVLGTPEPQPENSFGEQYEDIIPADATVSSYEAKRFSLMTGQVFDVAGEPLSDVRVTILGNPEYGTVVTDPEGRFIMPVEGGLTLTVIYKKEGMIESHREVYISWNDIAIVEAVHLVSLDPVSTEVVFDGDPNRVVTHQSTQIVDEFGSRATTVIFTGDNIAYLVDEDGNDVQPLYKITTRATEFITPEVMPAVLPPASAFTYCVELSVDGAQRVRFEKPVVTFVDNFLGFDVGDIVPVGYYDREQGVWVPSDNGVVVRLLDINSDGLVDALDADGDDQPDDIDGNGSFGNEVTGLDDPARYAPGSTFWRVMVSHFTPWDHNWPFGPPSDSSPPNPPTPPSFPGDQPDDPADDPGCNTKVNSYVNNRDRVYHEDIAIPGTDFSLHYSSARASGNLKKITVFASGSEVPASLKRIIVTAEIAGHRFVKELSGLPNQTVEFLWDGLDFLGRPVRKVECVVKIGFVYGAVYYAGADFARSFANVSGVPTAIRSRQEIV